MNYDKENYVEAGKQFELFLISMKKGSEILKSTHRDLTPGMMDFIEDIFQQEKYAHMYIIECRVFSNVNCPVSKHLSHIKRARKFKLQNKHGDALKEYATACDEIKKILTCCQASKSKNDSYTKGKQIYDLAKLFKIWSDNILDYMNNISPANNKCGRWNGIVDGFTEKKVEAEKYLNLIKDLAHAEDLITDGKKIVKTEKYDKVQTMRSYNPVDEIDKAWKLKQNFFHYNFTKKNKIDQWVPPVVPLQDSIEIFELRGDLFWLKDDEKKGLNDYP